MLFSFISKQCSELRFRYDEKLHFSFALNINSTMSLNGVLSSFILIPQGHRNEIIQVPPSIVSI